jgi:uncharacterized protein (DUF305 family)
MDTKTLAAAIAAFLLGGFTVSVAATLEDGDEAGGSGMTMSQMNDDLREKSGDEYDAAFLALMIEHHEGALDMAKLSVERAEHAEVQRLSEEIVDAQEREIAQMRRWQDQWGYDDDAAAHDSGH